MARTAEMTADEEREMMKAFATPATGQEIARAPGTTGELEISGGVITARKVDVARDEARVLQKIKAMAAFAGDDWYYSYPVFNRRKNRTEAIEGPSIKCANNVARIYGNCQVDTRVVDAGDTWIIYARFVDYETGFSMARPFQQDKAAAKLGGDDAARKRDIALQIGVSKSIRNVVCNSLEFFTDFAFDEAKKGLVDRVGKNLDQYKQRIADKLAALEVGIERVEAVVGKPLDKWTASDAAKVVAELQSVSDGMAMADDVWPKPAPPEPRRSDATDVHDESGEKPANDAPKKAGREPTDDAPPPSPHPAQERAPVWSLPADIVGQDNVIRGFENLLSLVKSAADVDEIEKQNGDRLAKITGNKRAALNDEFRKAREQFK